MPTTKPKRCKVDHKTSVRYVLPSGLEFVVRHRTLHPPDDKTVYLGLYCPAEDDAHADEIWIEEDLKGKEEVLTFLHELFHLSDGNSGTMSDPEDYDALAILAFDSVKKHLAQAARLKASKGHPKKPS